MAARSGAQYLEGLRDGREVWYSGERVPDVTTHPVFAAGAQSIARLYDLQHEPEYREVLTYLSPKTGERVGLSFLMPRQTAELVQRRTMLEVWAKASCGLLAQSPDYMNIGIMSLAAAHDALAKADPRFGIHALRYYEICREQDRCLARVVPTAWPQTTTVSTPSAETLPCLQVVAQKSTGVVVRGTCMLAPLALFADDLVVYGGAALQPGEGARALVCAVPVASPGVSLVCRESVGPAGSHFDHPLASRFEVLDCIARFDDVLIPWEGVFLHSNVELYNRLESSVRFFWQVGHQVVTRQIAKTVLLLGIAHLLSETSGMTGLLHVQEKLGEIVTYVETLRSCQRRAEVDAVMGANGVLYPQGDAVHAALRLFPMVYPRLIEILQRLGAGGYMMMPSAGALQSPLAEAITQCYQGATVSATARMQLFRLAWDLVGESFGARQQLYERYGVGDPAHMLAARYLDYDKTAAVERVQTLLETAQWP
jgi:4-hydroxyphenylacetate 3-monooxygenase